MVTEILSMTSGNVVVPASTWAAAMRELTIYKTGLSIMFAISLAYLVWQILKSPEEKARIRRNIESIISISKKLLRWYCPPGNWRYYLIYTSFILTAMIALYIVAVWIGTVSYSASMHNSLCMYYGAYDPVKMDPLMQGMFAAVNNALLVFFVFILSQIILDIATIVCRIYQNFNEDSLTNLSGKIIVSTPDAVILSLLCILGLPYFLAAWWMFNSWFQSILTYITIF